MASFLDSCLSNYWIDGFLCCINNKFSFPKNEFIEYQTKHIIFVTLLLQQKVVNVNHMTEVWFQIKCETYENNGFENVLTN
jgi:hypothetical protein